MRTIKSLVSYDGSNFCGWQIQKKESTIQLAVESALRKIHGRRIQVTAASRTDSGVHARGQVIHFRTDSKLSDRKLKDALNFYLPDDIVLRGLKTVQDSFNARYDVTSKKYRYTIYTGETRPIFDAKYAYWCRRKLNISRMRKAAKFIIGEHDFTSFSSNHDERESKVLKISSIKVKKVRDYVTIDFAANRFLRNMIRIIVGTLIDVGAGKTESRDMRDIVNSKDRRSAGATASAKGLTLVEVCY